jgi:hypothetical protein
MKKKPFDFAAQRSSLKDFSYYQQHFTLHPKQLSGCALPVRLAWRSIPFRKRFFPTVMNTQGVYAFSVRHVEGGLPPHGYVVYIGQTGAKKSETNRTLRTRVKEYHREKKEGTRLHVAEFLNKWAKCLSFHYAPVKPGSADLLELETKLNDALMPPYSVRDFSADIRKRKRLLEKK